MTTKIITFPGTTDYTIDVNTVKNLIVEEGRGLIFVHDQKSGELVGSVVYYNDEWTLSTFNDEYCDDSLAEVCEGFEYEYRYKVKE